MSPIEQLLRTGKSALDTEVEPVEESEIIEAERILSFSFPASYREFVMLGGLQEMRFSNRVLRPTEISAAWGAIPGGRRIPFAENGCGDSYCWVRSVELEPPIVFVDHENGESPRHAESFTAWLMANRF